MKKAEMSTAENFPAARAKAAGVFLEHVEKTTSPGTNFGSHPQLSRSQKIKKHYKRFWCCYLLSLVIFLAAFLPILSVFSPCIF